MARLRAAPCHPNTSGKTDGIIPPDMVAIALNNRTAMPVRAPAASAIRAGLRLLIALLIAGMNWTGLAAVGTTLAYYSDGEASSENALGAGSLDFSLVPASHMKSIGLAEEVSVSSVLVNSGTLDWRYTVEAEKVSGSDDFCGALELEAKLNGVEKYDGSLLSLDVPSLTALGTWKFNIEFPVDAVGVAHGDTCEVDFVYKGWQTEIPLYEDSGFTDEERISVTLAARMIVLNEFLPNPEGEAYGFDFGDDSDNMPQGEWVELYNNSDSSFDLASWYIWDASGAEANKIVVTAANTDLATTVIPAGGWLVVYMNKAVLNNTGDTVKLFDGSDTLIDSRIYVSNDFCEIEPTPGEDNSTTVSGECGGVPPNKSYARIPDGIGEWVDPIPTPGGVNRLNEVEEVIVTPDTGSSQTSVPADDTSTSDEPAPPEDEAALLTDDAEGTGGIPPADDASADETLAVDGTATEESSESPDSSGGEPAAGEPVIGEDENTDAADQSGTDAAALIGEGADPTGSGETPEAKPEEPSADPAPSPEPEAPSDPPPPDAGGTADSAGGTDGANSGGETEAENTP